MDNIEDFIAGKGKELAGAIQNEYDEHSFSFESLKVEEEIYERCLHETTVFLLIMEMLNLIIK